MTKGRTSNNYSILSNHNMRGNWDTEDSAVLWKIRIRPEANFYPTASRSRDKLHQYELIVLLQQF